MVDHTFVYTGAVRKIAALIGAGELGRVLYVDSVRINLGPIHLQRAYAHLGQGRAAAGRRARRGRDDLAAEFSDLAIAQVDRVVDALGAALT